VGAPIPDAYVLMVDPLIGLTVAAAVTKTLRLGTGVCLIPEHHPVALAKRIASLDLYSNGRFILGTGAGWQPEESAALGGDFPRRWAQTAESLTIMHKLWTEDAPAHAGTYYQFPPLRFHPKPVQTPRPPILLGGTSPRVFQRAAMYADGWAPWMIDPAGLATGRAQLLDAFARAGRDPATAEGVSQGWRRQSGAQAGRRSGHRPSHAPPVCVVGEGHIGPAPRGKTLSSRQRLAMIHGGGYDAGHRHGSVWSPTTWEVRHGPHTNRHTRPRP
jgi:probable F420-dependent oxidoreductase